MGNAFIDYSILNHFPIEPNKDYYFMILDCPAGSYTCHYDHLRCPELMGSKNIPIYIKKADGDRQYVQVYMSDDMIGQRELVLQNPYIHTLPYLHSCAGLSTITSRNRSK